MNRLFFAIDIEKTYQQKIAQWRDEALALPFKRIPHSNFHITLAFIGTVNDEVQQALIEFTNELVKSLSTSPPISLKLSRIGLFKQPQVLMLAPSISSEIDSITGLAEKLSRHARTLSIYQEDRAYNPHLSLYRKAKFLPPDNQCSHNITVKTFSLYHSYSTEHGVQYIPIKTWSLPTTV